MAFNYYIYGFYVKSEFRLYNIPEIDTINAPDIVITKGFRGVDDSIYYSRNCPIIFEDNNTQFSSSIGFFAISNGNRIVVIPGEESNEKMVASCILGWCMAFVLTQRGYSLFHGSALVKDGKCFIISGSSGAGKSTLSLQFVKKGYKYLADDLVLVDPNNSALVVPAYPLQKYCSDVIDSNQIDATYKIDSERDKYSRINTDDFDYNPYNLSAIFFVDKTDSENVKIEKYEGFKKIAKMFSALFLSVVYAENRIPAYEKQNCLKIASNVDYYEIERPKDKNTLDELTRLIESIVDV